MYSENTKGKCEKYFENDWKLHNQDTEQVIVPLSIQYSICILHIMPIMRMYHKVQKDPR